MMKLLKSLRTLSAMLLAMALWIPPAWVPSAMAEEIAGPDLVARFAGTYEIGALLAQPAVREALEQVAGPHLEHLLRNLGATGPVDLISNWLVISGLAPHSGTEEEAIVCIWPGEPVAVQAAIFSHGDIRVLTISNSYMNLPLAIKDWITQVSSLHRDRMTQPANVELVVTPPGSGTPGG